MTSSRMQRLQRGTATATFATFAALAGHIVGGGSAPTPLGVLAPLVLSIAVCTFLSGRRLSPLRLIASVGVAQTLFHLLFVLGTPSGAASGHQHRYAQDAAAALDALPLADTGDAAGASMWMGHALAMLITSAVLFWAERVLDGVAALAGRIRSRALRSLSVLAAVRPAVAPVPPTFVDVTRPLLEPRVSRASRRGPPFAAA